jgi:CubicO group peptidase (beta-lactamase class C family)
VIKYLPEFRLKDVHAMHHMTIRDLVTHRSGLPHHDFVWYNSKASQEELFSRLQHLEPTCDLREKFQYNNLMYMVAGILIKKVTGRSWEEAVDKRIFSPLGMSRSNCSVEISKADGDFSMPYRKAEEKICAIPFKNICSVGPAGSINSSAEDMAKWVQVQLSDGTLEERRVISKEMLKEMHSVQTPIQFPLFNTPEESPYLFGYGLGWMTGLYKGHYTVTHGGGIDGFISHVVLLPTEKIGVVLLTNVDSHPLFASYASFALADCVLGKEEEWIGPIAEKEKALLALTSGKPQTPFADPQTARPLSDYVGEFDNPGYGSLRIFVKDDELISSYNDITSVLAHKCFDHFTGTMKIVYTDSKFACSFTRDAFGDVADFLISIDPTASPVVFKRKASEDLFSEKYLKQFEGIFEDVGFSLVIAFKRNCLMASVAGQPAYELLPNKPYLFSLKELTGFSARFVPNAEGKITEVQLIQPNGTFDLKAKPE